MASRIGIMNTAIRTADSGALHRRVNKVMETTRVTYNGATANAEGVIFDFVTSDGYGADSLIEISSPGTGSVWTPFNLTTIVGRLNLEAGY